ncbi:magnesium and cobalt transport protein CorA [Candidatus Uhrbacteria bacterium RIFCSPLOWO2_02_FULL_54_37]|uniref:Magnesium transport protein CorA n=1 Tax=Candidatus Uhrbacteria bacterium RIFCSPLOWO2_02_FULL_54_37 TaxID=1802412 RepID=A0A1F7VL18_9BACT|nr:MAG: magnesium and cobalt transport protein CorA [Candidatus Uhrbacteria bacterium RIFCSPLOWO2_02_FULL_54_37]
MITLITKEGEGLKEQKGVGMPELKALKAHEAYWVDFCEPTKEEAELLASFFHFHPLAISDCEEELHHPKAETYGDVLFLVFHEPRYGEKRFVTREVEFFLNSQFLVTYHKNKLPQCQVVREQLLKRPELFDRGTDFLLYLHLDEIIDTYFPVLDKLEERIDRLEDSIVMNPSKDTVNGIFALKREVLHLKKVIGPQREILNRFTRAEFPQVTKTSLVYFRDLYDHIYRIYDLSESFRDLLSGALDAYLSSLSNRMNEIMKVLTIITTILLPLSLIAGIYGMNFRYMPELSRPWGYPFVLLLMVLIAFGMVRFFKRKGWM